MLINFQAKPKSTGLNPFRLKENKKNRVKDPTWRSKYNFVLTNVIKSMKNKSRAIINESDLCKVSLKTWHQGTPITRRIRQNPYGFLRFCVAEIQYESTWLLPAVTETDLITTKKWISYLLTEYEILQLLDSFQEDYL